MPYASARTHFTLIDIISALHQSGIFHVITAYCLWIGIQNVIRFTIIYSMCVMVRYACLHTQGPESNGAHYIVRNLPDDSSGQSSNKVKKSFYNCPFFLHLIVYLIYNHGV